MLLDKYLKDNGISVKDFAKSAGVPEFTVYRLRKRPWTIPGADLALRVIEASRGAVTLRDLVLRSRYGAIGPPNGKAPPGAAPGGRDPAPGPGGAV